MEEERIKRLAQNDGLAQVTQAELQELVHAYQWWQLERVREREELVRDLMRARGNIKPSDGFVWAEEFLVARDNWRKKFFD